ncbi:MAG: endonuclease [Candidatus Atribacteria bacterium]|uniref:Endonuclease III n=1 Tax=Thermatribacter velox TaxID=3039681 RepID=A0ABZ2YBI8_9BACT|nr:endonuclease [Candidatus Atribacteria bacterium]
MSESKANSILDTLETAFPDARLLLDFRNPFELLVATVLAAQAPDERVNQITPHLFQRFPDALSMAEAPLEAIEEAIKTVSYFRQKARFLKEMSKVLVERFEGKVPASLEELVTLPGVGRKTANVVLANAFSIPALPVDTHVARVAQRLGLAKSNDAEKIEMELCAQIPQERWIRASHLLGFLGRRVCKARKPLCEQCPVTRWCDFFEKNR